MTTTTIKLFCLVRGDDPRRTFTVQVTKTDTVGDLKKLVKAEKSHKLGNIDADELTLWRVNIPKDDLATLTSNFDIKDDGIELSPFDEIQDIFPEGPASKHLHIVVEMPLVFTNRIIEAFQVFDVVVKPRTKASFPWYTNINETTINDFKEKITKEYPDTEEDVDDATVTILVGEKSTTIANDSDLRSTLNVFAVSGIKKFTVSLEKLSKAFTAFKFSEVCRLFEISGDTDPSIAAFPEFHCDSMTIDENEHDLKHLIEDLKLLRRTTEVDLSNEATRSLYVDRFIVAAVSSFDKDVIVRPQKQLRGRHGQGPVDLGLESRHTTNTLGVTEIKKDDIKKGIAQNALQLEACLTISRKRKRDEVVEDPVMLKHAYGIITDAEKWYFLHCINDDKITFRLSKPVSVDWFSDYSNDVKTVLEHILWLLKEMGKAETETGVHWDTDISG